jgi:hypothetical protein
LNQPNTAPAMPDFEGVTPEDLRADLANMTAEEQRAHVEETLDIIGAGIDMLRNVESAAVALYENASPIDEDTNTVTVDADAMLDLASALLMYRMFEVVQSGHGDDAIINAITAGLNEAGVQL